MPKVLNNANRHQKSQESDMCFKIMRKLLLNYARSSRVHPRIKCDPTVLPNSPRPPLISMNKLRGMIVSLSYLQETYDNYISFFKESSFLFQSI
jgi:hypothetical protein